MKAKILLNSDANVRQEAEEQKYIFLHGLLSQMGVPVEDFWKDPGSLDIHQRVKLKEILSAYSVEIYDDLDGHMQIFVDKQLVGEFFKSIYKIRRDLRAIDPKKQLFIEMEVSHWSLFEEAEHNK